MFQLECPWTEAGWAIEVRCNIAEGIPSPSLAWGRERRPPMVYVPVCDFDDHFWPKKKHLFYIAVGNGGEFSRYRKRFCTFHVATVEEYLSQYELVWPLPADRVDDRRMVKCLSCGKPVQEGGIQVFITGYPTQDQRKDYWGVLHDGHRLPEYLQEFPIPAMP